MAQNNRQKAEKFWGNRLIFIAGLGGSVALSSLAAAQDYTIFRQDYLSQDIERDIERQIERDIERDIEEDIERDIEREIQREIERNIEREIERNIEREIERYFSN